jgi:hypothetical protein
MKVKELIEVLNQCDSNDEIKVLFPFQTVRLVAY